MTVLQEYMQLFKDTVFAITNGGGDSCILVQYAFNIVHIGCFALLTGYDPDKTELTLVPIVAGGHPQSPSTQGTCVLTYL